MVTIKMRPAEGGWQTQLTAGRGQWAEPARWPAAAGSSQCVVGGNVGNCERPHALAATRAGNCRTERRAADRSGRGVWCKPFPWAGRHTRRHTQPAWSLGRSAVTQANHSKDGKNPPLVAHCTAVHCSTCALAVCQELQLLYGAEAACEGGPRLQAGQPRTGACKGGQQAVRAAAGACRQAADRQAMQRGRAREISNSRASAAVETSNSRTAASATVEASNCRTAASALVETSSCSCRSSRHPPGPRGRRGRRYR